MVVRGKRKRVLVNMDRQQKASYQPQLDHIMLIMGHALRRAALEFLNHARQMGEALQTFSSIQHALDSKNKRLSTSDLDYHLKELKKATFIEQMTTTGGKTSGYLLTEKGRQLTEKYLEMKNIKVDAPVLEPNVLEDHVHVKHILALTRPIKQEPHVTSITIEPRHDETAADRFLVDRAREVVEKKYPPRPATEKRQAPRDTGEKKSPSRKSPGGFSSLDTFR
jgi:DNA-binding PadR family transcriptional regulator